MSALNTVQLASPLHPHSGLHDSGFEQVGRPINLLLCRYCGTIKLMAGDDWEAVAKPELAKRLGASLWQKMQDLGF